MNKTISLLTVAVAVLLPPSVGMSQQVVRWEPTLESAQRVAAQTNRLVLIYFSGPQCGYCRRMEAEVLPQPSVVAAINADYVAVKVTADYFPSIARRYNITHLPTTVIALPQGQPIDSKEGFVATNDYATRLGQVAYEAKRRRDAVVAQLPTGTPPLPATNPLAMNPPTANRPVGTQPMGGQPMGGQPMGNQPSPGQVPYGVQPPLGPSVATTVPPDRALPSPVSPPYGGTPRPIASPPPMMQQQPPVVAQQPPYMPPPNREQIAVAPPQDNRPPQAVPGNSPVGLEGCCPVSLLEKQQWLAGDRRWGADHRGRLYFFTGPEEQRRFFADPDRYAPMVSGNDIVLAAEGQAVPGTREFGVYYQKHVYLFSNPATRAKFEANPAAYANQALQALRSGAYQPGTQWR